MTYKEIRNIQIVPQPQRDRIKNLVNDADIIFAHNNMEGGLIHSSFYDSIEGQIIRSLKPKEAKGQYHNKLNDFYIDSRVRFKEMKDLRKVMGELEEVFKQITKFTKQQFHVGDWVKIPEDTNYPALKDHAGKKGKIVKLSGRNIAEPDYEGFYIRIEGKGSHVYASSRSVKKLGQGWHEKPDHTGKAKRHKEVQTRRKTQGCLTQPIQG